MTAASSQTNQSSSTNEQPRPYKCPMCEKAFHRLEHQTRHIRTHTGEKPHACTYPGCQKRFSRSDELTRHSRIHTNSNPRRNYKNQSPLSRNYSEEMAPPKFTFSKSAPTSKVGSPSASPPHLHAQLSASQASGVRPNVSSAGGHNNLPLPFDMHMLATAASQQLERENLGGNNNYSSRAQSSFHSHVHPPHNHHHHHHRFPGLTPLTPYNAQTSGVRHSHDEDSSFQPRHTKRSRPNSPVSTAPSSPTFSSSDSPTPDHTPLVTPAHSPRLHPRELEALQGVQLPSIRSLSLRHMPPPLVPLEVDGSSSLPGSTSVSRSTSSTNLRGLNIVDMLSGPISNSQTPSPLSSDSRILPPPSSMSSGSNTPSATTSSFSSTRVSVADLINGGGDAVKNENNRW
ncbi:hypothetical protein V1511DRAFT_458509 [Dipodascopsis uninucleata]